MTSLPPYTLFYQKPYCCAMACLQMVVFRRTGKVFDQEEMAWQFGVRVSKDLKAIYARPFKHLTSHGKDEGVPTMRIVGMLGDFFKKESLALEAEAHAGTDRFVAKLGPWLTERLREGDDVWAEYVFGEEGWESYYIHDSLVESYDTATETVSILDPNPDALNRRTIPLAELGRRISGKLGKRTGILTISKKKKGVIGRVKDYFQK